MKKVEASTLSFQGDLSLLNLTELFDVKTIKEASELNMGILKDYKMEDFKRVDYPLVGTTADSCGMHPWKGLVLAQGESRNHFHAFRDPSKVELYKHANDNAYLLLVKDEPQCLHHEEHWGKIYNPGVYFFEGQEEWDDEEEYQRVAD